MELAVPGKNPGFTAWAGLCDTILASSLVSRLKLIRDPFQSELNPVIHPLLTPRLFCQTNHQAPLPRRTAHNPHPVRDYLMRRVSRLYRRWGSGFGFLLGLAIALWVWLPDYFL